MQLSWLVLLPPVVVLIAAFITQNLNRALIIGILFGAFIATDFSFIATLQLTGSRLYQTVTDPENLYIYAFLFLISIIVVLLNQSGGARAFASTITKRLKSARMAESSSLLLSITLFIDDYLSALTVGYVMQPITDRFAIARAKLAFLVHGMTGPLVIIAPISSWVATITTTLEQAGIAAQATKSTKIIADPYFIYLQTIPYIFYSFLVLASLWFIVFMRLSFGPMRRHELIAQQTGNLCGGKEPITIPFDQSIHKNDSLADLLVPLLTLIGSIFIGILWTGNYYLFGGTNSLLNALKSNTEIFWIFFLAGIITCIVSFTFALVRHKIATNQVPTIVLDGIKLIISAVIMVILASTLGKLLRIDLLTGNYLATILHESLSLWLLPCVFFMVSAITSLMTGSSWGTMMLLIPIAIPMLVTLGHVAIPTTPDQISIMFPILGAIFSGAVCGDHLSPISQTTIMVATSCGAYPIDHAQTQFVYFIPALIGAAVSFLLSGFFTQQSSWVLKIVLPLGIGILFCYVMLYGMNFMGKRKQEKI